MRQIYSSPRMENIERVEVMLNEQGINTRLSNRPSIGGRGVKRAFSYREAPDSSQWPTLWVLQAEDFSRARELMREAGLLEETRTTYLSDEMAASLNTAPKAPPTPAEAAAKARRYAITVLMLMMGVVVLKMIGVF